jgi:hypothetical protein
MKKLVSFILVLVALCCITVPAFAEPPDVLPLPTAYDPQPIDNDLPTVSLYGTVEASILSAEVTLSTYFTIDPNVALDSRFVSPSLTIKNTSTMPIEVSALSMKATGIAPKVVAVDKYSQEEWDTLGTADTHANIAIGLTGAEAGDFWFAEEEAQEDTPVAGLDSQESAALGMQCKHGLSWAEAENFKYEMVFELAIKQ